MADINLSPNLQAKLQPYFTLRNAKSVDEAIEMAKADGKWSETDTKELNKLNGGANWGKVMDEYSFDSSKAEQYKSEHTEAQKQNELAQARRRNEKKQELKAREERKQENRNTLAALAKGLVKGLLALTPLGWTACENKIDVDQIQIVKIPIEQQKDYSQQISDILQRLDRIDNNNEQRYAGILQKLNDLINSNSATKTQYMNVFNELKGFLQTIIDNQVAIKTDNNNNAADILAQLALILAKDTSIESKMPEIMDLLGQIKSIGEGIDSKIVGIANQLTSLEGLVTTYGEKGAELRDAILNAIQELDFDTTVEIDLSGIEAMLIELVNGQKTTNDGITNLTNLFNTFSGENITKLNTIISKLDKSSPDYSTELNRIIKLLEQLDANNNTRNEKILNAIDKLGVKISGDLTAIYNKIQTSGGTTTVVGKDYSDVLDAILKKLDSMQKDNNNNFAAILNALGNINIKPQDLSWIKSHLDAILEAIKDHEVHVTVEGNKCCCCDKNGNPVHEGVLGNLNDLLG